MKFANFPSAYHIQNVPFELFTKVQKTLLGKFNTHRSISKRVNRYVVKYLKATKLRNVYYVSHRSYNSFVSPNLLAATLKLTSCSREGGVVISNLVSAERFRNGLVKVPVVDDVSAVRSCWCCLL